VKVPFFDPLRGDLDHEVDLLLACKTVLRRGSYILGPEVEAFEQEAAAYLGARHAVGVSSGTDALIVALLALGIGPGDEVLVPAYTFVATASAVVRVGARPVFVDVEPDTLCIDREFARDWGLAQWRRTKAIVQVHLFGRRTALRTGFPSGDYGKIPVIDDAAQAFRARTLDNGIVSCHSFYPTKNLGGFGDGGMVTTDDDALAERARMLRGHGSRERYRHEEIGGNFRLDELQAALLRVKLRHVDAALEARALHAATYHALIGDQVGDRIVRPPIPSDTWNQYVIRVHGEGARDRLRAHLAERGVGTEVYYPTPLHLQPCFAFLGYRVGDFPVAEAAARETLALPIFPELTSDEIAYVVEQIAAFSRLKGLS
jgi:dTDP-4-amino-4,6-dideoxygalactose transaminase